MKLRTVFFLFAIFISSALSWGQSWNLTQTMTATLDGNGLLTISTANPGGEAMPDYNPYDAPWYPVCSSIFSVVIGDNVTSIGSYAFLNCSNLTSATISNTVTVIGINAFYLCSKLSSFIIPNSVTTIKGGAFIGCRSLTSILIPKSVTNIEVYAFMDCSGLKDVTVEWNTAASIPSLPYTEDLYATMTAFGNLPLSATCPCRHKSALSGSRCLERFRDNR